MAISSKKVEFFQISIIEWYKENGRHFPWRNPSVTNYQKIISEILLQRTKAETVAKFFPPFIRKYPSWKRLGDATELELHEVLKPIGLYRQRGTRLFKLAQEMKKRSGKFPKKREEVEGFSMMGQYITNAYELLILNKPVPLLDVNMARVLERFFGSRKLADIRYDTYLQNLSAKIANHSNPIIMNWAILDFAALVCWSKNPRCKTKCPIKLKCNTYSQSYPFEITAS